MPGPEGRRVDPQGRRGGPMGPSGFQTIARELQTCTFGGFRPSKTPQKFHEKTPRERKNENCGRRGKKRAKFWAVRGRTVRGRTKETKKKEAKKKNKKEEQKRKKENINIFFLKKNIFLIYIYFHFIAVVCCDEGQFDFGQFDFGQLDFGQFRLRLMEWGKRRKKKENKKKTKKKKKKK